MRADGQHPGDRHRVERLTADEEIAHRGEGVGSAPADQIEHRGGHDHGGDGPGRNGLGETVGVEQGVGIDELEAAAVGERAPELEGQGVEGRVRCEPHDRGGVERDVVGVVHEALDPGDG